MADAERLTALLELLADQIDDLKESLAPLTSAPLSQSAAKLPLLDKAKLHVLVSYSIESLLFTSLRLSEVKTKDHPIMTEITRVRQYVAKVKEAEKNAAAAPQESQNLKLDKAAAGRILGAAMREYDRSDKKRSEEQEKEREGARRKLEAMGPGTKDPLGERAEVTSEEEGLKGLDDDEMEVDSATTTAEKTVETTKVTTTDVKEKKEKRKGREDEDPAERKRRKAEKKERKEAKEKKKAGKSSK